MLTDWLIKENRMLTEKETKSANYLRILSVLKAMLEKGTITKKEYHRAAKYYRQLTGADIVLCD